MRPLILLLSALLLASVWAPAQMPPEESDVQLPSGKSQKEEILKSDHAKSVKDAAKLARLSEELAKELEANDRHVLSVTMLKNLDEMEKLVKRIRSRLKRF